MNFSKFIVGKGIWYLLCVIAAYSVASFFNIVPKPIQDLLKWASDNTTTFVVAGCFIVGCWALVKISGHKKRGES